MIVFDTEGTDLLKPDVAPLSDQPHLVEFAGVKLDAKLKEIARLQFHCAPGIPLPATFIKITGITEETIKDAKPFAAHYRSLCDFFLGEEEMTAHNLGYDEGILKYALLRIQKLLHFPWPRKHTCTVEVSQGIKGHRLSLSDLHMMALGKEQEERDQLVWKVGNYVKHKTRGKGTILEIAGDSARVDFDGKVLNVKKSLLKGAAFEGAHGAMKDVEELVTAVRWLRGGGYL